MKILWDRDGVAGGPSSIKVLLDWLTSERNYAKWKGEDGSYGSTKEALCEVIIDKLKEVGITHRKPADVRDKIRYLEKQFRRAVEWTTNAGQGVSDDTTIRPAILQLCPCYYQLARVMGDNPPSEPCQTTGNSNDDGDNRNRKRPLSVAEITGNKKQHGSMLRILPKPHEIGQKTCDKGNRTLLELHGPSQQPRENGNSTCLERREPSRHARGSSNTTLAEVCEPSQQALAGGKTTLLELEEKRLELELRREAREEAQAKAEVELIHAKRRSVEIDNTTRLLLARKQLKDAGYTDQEIDAHLPLNNSRK
ncbi:hypothetical protein GN244_ATG04713 [Phytophthora infestans]|nr:hypothetical protein GN244_ATG04713 [Phytophthora infestans]